MENLTEHFTVLREHIVLVNALKDYRLLTKSVIIYPNPFSTASCRFSNCLTLKVSRLNPQLVNEGIDGKWDNFHRQIFFFFNVWGEKFASLILTWICLNSVKYYPILQQNSESKTFWCSGKVIMLDVDRQQAEAILHLKSHLTKGKDHKILLKL